MENLQAKRRRSVCPIMSPMSSLPSCDGTPILMRRLPLSKHPQRSRLGRKSPAANRFHPGRTCFLASAPQRGVGRWLYWGESTDTRRQRCSTNQLNSFGPAAPNNVFISNYNETGHWKRRVITGSDTPARLSNYPSKLPNPTREFRGSGGASTHNSPRAFIQAHGHGANEGLHPGNGQRNENAPHLVSCN